MRVELPGDQFNGHRVAAVALVLIDRDADQPALRNEILERDRLCRRHRARGRVDSSGRPLRVLRLQTSTWRRPCDSPSSA